MTRRGNNAWGLDGPGTASGEGTNVYVERLLQINIAALASLATLQLGMGQRSTWTPLGMMLAAMASVWVTDVKRWFVLNKRVAEWASLAALIVCLPQALRWERFAMIAAVADFVVLLQAIQLFRDKDPGVYWQIVRLSVLQVVVAALLTQDILFGVLLVAYLFTAMGAMALLFLYSEWRRHERQSAAGPGRASVLPGSPRSLSVNPAGAWQTRRQASGQDARAGASEKGFQQAKRRDVPPLPENAAELRPAASSSPRWPLAHQTAAYWTGATGRVPLGREFFFRLFKIGSIALFVGVVVFAAMPRMGRGAWRGIGGFARATVGFSGGVRLGALGKIIQNPQEVMRVWFYRTDTEERYEVQGSVYFRGAVLTEYRRGEWRPPFDFGPFRAAAWVPSDQVVRPAPVRQVIHLEPLDREELFCVWPFTFLEQDRRIGYYAWAQRLVRRREYQRDRFVYELGTTAFFKNEQAALVPDEEKADLRPLLQMPEQGGKSTVPGLVALASEWIQESAIPPKDRLHRAQWLERRLRDSGRFSYTLEGQVRDASLDPIEDFVTKNPRGHCEYFATALCLMLRSQGIPARVVIGYRTEDYNELGQYFRVRQLHAHTWVEAYIPAAQIPDEIVRQRPSWQWLHGAWLRLDATPSSQETSPTASLMARIGGWFDWLNFAWTSYVMEMDRPRQRVAIYQPVADALRALVRNVADPEWWRSWARRVADFLGLSRWMPGNGWFSWRAATWWALGAAAALGLYRMLRAAAARWLAPLLEARGKRRRAAQASVEFYRRFEALLARRGFARRRSQTQREFALTAAAALDRANAGSRLAEPAAVVAEAFYRVRFGGTPLEDAERRAVESALERFAESVRRKA